MATKPVTVEAFRKAIEEINQPDPMKSMQALQVALNLKQELGSDELSKMPPMQGEAEEFRLGIMNTNSSAPVSRASADELRQEVTTPKGPKPVKDLTFEEAVTKAEQARQRMQTLEVNKDPKAAAEMDRLDFFKDLAATKLVNAIPKPKPSSGDFFDRERVNEVLQGIRTAGQVELGRGAVTVLSESAELGRVVKQIDDLMGSTERKFETNPSEKLMNDIAKQSKLKALDDFTNQNMKAWDKREDRELEQSNEQALEQKQEKQESIKPRSPGSTTPPGA